tara:strand:+ start:703 stop:1080 length:378 start_codon:yes stop_codon:yes gene_type:complete
LINLKNYAARSVVFKPGGQEINVVTTRITKKVNLNVTKNAQECITNLSLKLSQNWLPQQYAGLEKTQSLLSLCPYACGPAVRRKLIHVVRKRDLKNMLKARNLGLVAFLNHVNDTEIQEGEVFQQ